MKIKGKKKNKFLSKLKPKLKKGAKINETEKFLLKQRALVLMTDQQKSAREVSRILKTTLPTIKSFLEDEDFVEELRERIEYIDGIDEGFCIDQSRISLSQLYESFRTRISIGELEDIPMRDLFRMITETQRELRLDSPGSVTSKVGLVDLSNLQDRYSNSLSGKMKRSRSRKKLSKPGDLGEEKEKRSIRRIG